MNIAFYTAGSGMLAFQKDLDVVSNNIANVNTNGFKGSRSSFRELIATEMDTNQAAEKNHMVGHGTDVRDVQVLMKQGMLERTDYGYDYAIVGDGFFCVDRGGEKQYTRNGGFAVGLVGKKPYLTARDGSFVLDDRGRRIQLAVNDGGVADPNSAVEHVGVYTFTNPEGLNVMGNTSYTPSATSGAPKAMRRNDKTSETELIQGALERTTVDIGEEMVKVIQSQRAFGLNSKIVQTADQLEEMVNNLR